MAIYSRIIFLSYSPYPLPNQFPIVLKPKLFKTLCHIYALLEIYHHCIKVISHEFLELWIINGTQIDVILYSPLLFPQTPL